MRAVDGHPADRIEQDDVVDDRLHRRAPGRRRAWPDPARRRRPPCRAGPGRARRGSTGRPPRPSRPRDRGRPARAGQPAARRGRPPPRATRRGRRRPASATRRVPRTTRHGRAPRRAPPRPRRPGVATTTAGAVSGSRPRDVGAGHDPFGAREGVGIGDRIEDRDAPAGRRAERDERAGDGRRAGDPQDRRWQMRFHVDLQRAPGMTGHDQLDDAVPAPALGRRVLRQPEQPGLAVDERAKRLADDDRLGAAAADPALDRAVRMDDPGRAGTRRGRPPDRDDGGDRERPAGRLELGRPREDRPGAHRRPRPGPSRGGWPTPSGA